MSIPRPAGQYAEQMLEPDGWPDIDEDTFYRRAGEFNHALRKVTGVLETCHQQRAEIFHAGVWGGSAADAANGALSAHLDQLASLQGDLATAILWHNHVAGLSEQAKSAISDNVESAQQQINALENDPSLTSEERITAINKLLSQAYGGNVDVVADAAEQILGSKDWKPSQNAIQNLLDQRISPPTTPSTDPSQPVLADPTSPILETPGLPRPPSFSPNGAANVASGLESAIPEEEFHPAVAAAVPEQQPGVGEPGGGVAEETLQPGAGAVTNESASVAPAGATGRTTTLAAPTSGQRRSNDAGQVAGGDGMPMLAPCAANSGAAAGAGTSSAAGRASLGSSTAGRLVAPDNRVMRNRFAVRMPPIEGTPPNVIPVSAALAAREAISSASTAEALRRKNNGTDALQSGRRIAAALNAPDSGGADDLEFYWIVAVTTDDLIVVANSYGLAYIPDGVELPEQVQMASADDAIQAVERARYATYPMLAVQAWAAHHEKTLRAVIGTEEQLAQSDLGAAKIVLQPDDIPDSGKMTGRSRLEVVDLAAATRLAATNDVRLVDLLPPAPVDVNPPPDHRNDLLFDLFKPMISAATGREVEHLRAFHRYTAHAQEIALYQAHTAVIPADQRAAVADWLYWQHLTGLVESALSVAP